MHLIDDGDSPNAIYDERVCILPIVKIFIIHAYIYIFMHRLSEYVYSFGLVFVEKINN